MTRTSTSAKKTVTVVQTGSPIGRRADQEATLRDWGSTSVTGSAL